MDNEERLKTLREEFEVTTKELKKILFDIRIYLMEAETPIPNDLERERLDSVLDENDSEKRGALHDAQTELIKQEATNTNNDSEKGVEPNGKRQED